jgi:hypothetical protein
MADGFWLSLWLGRRWWRGNIVARSIVALILLCVLFDAVVGDRQITASTPMIERLADLAEVLGCAALAWGLSGLPGYWRAWREWRDRPPWYVDFYGTYTDKLR